MRAASPAPADGCAGHRRGEPRDAFLENHVGAELLHRTTRSLRLTGPASVCRSVPRVLTELEEADLVAGGERSAPRGTLSLTAHHAGEDILRSILKPSNEYQAVTARLILIDRQVNLIDEGFDRTPHRTSAIRTSSQSVSRRSSRGRGVTWISDATSIIRSPRICKHPIIAMTHFGLDSGAFRRSRDRLFQGGQFAPRLVVNTVRAAVASVTEGHGVTRLFSYHIADEIRDGRLQLLLSKDEHPPLPVHLLVPQGRLSVPKVRAFIDFATPRLKRYFTLLSDEAAKNAKTIRSRSGRVPSE